ncbi:probable chitinase 10 [Littorina saxatilis]|uniref:probable chitinase 10 n=1 Tax=Littorina saxatilis TaxID=31220 RepID=UPI0038B69376
MKDCSNMADGHFADLDNGCHSYYTCVGGAFVGHNFCPSSLVFNEDNKACDWPDNVSPPCGTHTGTMSP